MGDLAVTDAGRANPYVGPRAFHYGERIYGRGREIAELRDIVIARRLVLLYSPSGAGKSSLIEAGLRTELAQGGFRVFPTVRVGAEPPAELDGRIVRNRYVLSTIASLEEGRPVAELLSPAELATIELADYLVRLTVDDDDGGAEPCFVFDQFEELFTLDPTDVAAKRAFLTELGVALRDRGRWALFAMREDFIAQLDPYLGLLPTRLASRYRLDLLEPSAAKAAAQRPAAGQGVTFTDAAADRLMDDLRRVRVQRGSVATDELGPHVEPVQLQVVCRQLWNDMDPASSSIDVDDIVNLGNVDDALADFYVEQITAVAGRTGVSEREIRTWFDEELITPDGFRTQVLEGPGAAGAAILRELENAHLIRADRRRGTEWYELSHDRLVQPIQASNARWKDEHLNPLQREAQAWDARSRPQGLLVTGDVLAEAEEWARAHDSELLRVDREFLEACRDEQRRVDLERKVARRNRVLAVVATAVGILALAGLAVVARAQANAARERDRAAEERDRAETALQERDKAEAAQAKLNTSNAWLAASAQADDPRDQLLAWQAAFRANPDNTSADLTRKLTTAQHYLTHDPAYVATARALHPSGRTVARGTADGRVEIVDVDMLQRQPLVDLDVPIEAIAFDPAGEVLGVAAGSSVTLWQGGTQIGELTSSNLGKGFGAELSLAGADGLVSAVVYDTADDFFGELVLWQGGTEIASPFDAGTRVAKAVVAGSRLATVTSAQDGGAGVLRVWEPAGDGWAELQGFDLDLVPPDRPIMLPYAALTFDPESGLLAASTFDGLKLYALPGSSAAPTSQPADAEDDAFDSFAVFTAVAIPTADSLRTIDEGGQTAAWQLTSSGGWERSSGPALAPSLQVQMSADGGRALLGDRNTFAVFDNATGSQLLGQFAAESGATSAGRSVAVRRPGAVDDQPAPGDPWRRGGVDGTAVAALSVNGLALATVHMPNGELRLSTGQGADSTASCFPPSADGSISKIPTRVANADNAVAIALADRMADQPGGTGFGSASRSAVCVVGHPALADTSLEVAPAINAVAVNADGSLMVTGSAQSSGGSVDLIEGADFNLVDSQATTRPVTAVALSAGAAPSVAAGDDQGGLLVFDAPTDDTGADDTRCPFWVPTPSQVVSVAVGEGSDGRLLIAAATRKAVFTYGVDIAADTCATLTGGFDLLRDEGDVLDLSVEPDGSVTVLESDLNVFTFDPASSPATVSDDVEQRAAGRGWVLDAAECEALVQQPTCPT